MTACHERQISRHLSQLVKAREHAGAGRTLEALLSACAFMTHHRSDADFAALLHSGGHVTEAREKIVRFVEEVLIEASDAGEVRTDVPPEELAAYCIQALTAASSLRSGAAVDRLVTMTLNELRSREPTKY